jgi:hypothetical protein
MGDVVMNLLLQVNWLGDFTTWLKDAFLWLVHAIGTLLQEAIVSGLQAVCDFFLAIFNAIPTPDFLAQYSLGALLGNAGPTIGWICTTFRVGEGLAMLAAAIAFRLLRKLVTLGQW